MQELSINDILAAGDSDDKERKEEDDEEEEEYKKDTEIEEGKIPPPQCPTFYTTSINTNPFTLK